VAPASDDAPWVATVLEVWREGQARSMVGPGDPRAHLEHARRLASTLTEPARVLDLGSGAGIPGLALAGLWPASTWTLLDAAQRRVRVLEDAVERLGWNDRIQVVHGRAEEVGRRPAHREAYDLVVARSFGSPAVTAECGGAFVALGGALVVTEPPGAEPRWPAAPLAELGLEVAPPDAGFQRLVRVAPLDDRYPRRPGVPAKRPLF
jgi:16S rRNA (guanine527-N7)-methyltransferase